MNKWLRTMNRGMVNTNYLALIGMLKEREDLYLIVGWYSDDSRITIAEYDNEDDAMEALNRLSELLEAR